MKFKKSMLILILAVFLLSIAGVCASDVNDTAVTSQDSATVELTQIDESEEISSADESQVVGQTDNPEIMGANEKGTFTELKNEIQNGYNSNITLGRDYEYDGSGTEGIKITQSITIDGNGSTIDAKGESVIFDIRGGTVVIKNITFKNAHVPNAPPGAIRLDGVNFTISDCVFIGNSAYRFGGAIYAIDSTCTISDCVFLRNSVSYGPGGAICSLGPCTIRGCVFEDNSAQGGGAIYGGDSNIISDCVFVNNHISGNNGGAILFERGYCNISGCYFAENRGNNGIISLSSGQNTTINDNIFLNNNGDLIYIQNQASSANTDYNWFGNNATNYEDNPNVSGCNVWLFLDATRPDVASISDKSNITFKLYAYDSNEVSEYDNDRLKAVNLTLTPTNGNVNTTGVNLGKPVQFTAESPGISELTATIKEATYTISLPISDGTTFFDLNRTINGNDNDTIVLDRNYTYNPTFDYNLKGGVVIDRAVTIIGNGHILDAAGLARIFNIQADNVAINNITFTNGKTNFEGGAICWSGANGNLSGCSFVNNSVNYYGGAIYWNGAAGGLVSDCSFVNNSGSNGGALFLNAGAGAIVSDCTFANNSANYGGAIFCDSGVGDVVSGCSFVNNTAGVGGAIYWWSSNESLVYDCSFVNNSVRYYAAAIYWRGNDGNVSGCSFVNNSKYSIYFYNDENIYHNLSINDNIFLNNTGVAIYFVNNDSSSNADYNWFGNNATNYDIVPVTHNADVSAWLFLNATANPDAISIFDSSDIVFRLYAYNSSGVSEYDNRRLKSVNLTLTPTNGRVNTTQAVLGEAVQYNPESAECKLTASIENVSYTTTLKISDGTTFRDLNGVINSNDNDTIVLDRDYTYNPTFDADLKYGIVINRTLTIVGNGHTLNASGQAKIFHIQAEDVAIKNITFTNAYTGGIGGAIFWEGANGNVSGCLFANNSAAMAGAIVFYRSDGSVVTDSIFVNNSARHGGAIAWSESDEGVVENCNFVNNNASDLFGPGGAIYFEGSGNVINCNFTDNYGGYGGAVYFNNTGAVENCNFVNNTAVISGGAVLISDDGVVTDCNFTNNFAVTGGAILIDGEGIVENCIFVNNSVGGAVFIEEEGKLENCIFVNNSAEEYGGAVCLDSSGTIQNCNFTDNQAEIDGGAIYIEVYGIVENCIFVNNNATRYGGAICFYEEGDVTDCIFVNNSANVGGALLIYENADVTNCNFTNNTASSRAGAVYFNMYGDVTDCIFTNNAAGDYGGAIFFTYEGIVENCIFVNNNAAQDGGAVYFYSDSEVNNCNFTNNNATRYGGAVYFYSTGEVTNCNFTNNSGKYGGAIDFDDDATVGNCIFTNNSGKYGGAVFFYIGGDVTNCNFTNNYAEYGGAIYFDGDDNGGVVSSSVFVNNSGDNGTIYFNNENTGSNLKINDNIFLNNDGVAIYFVNSDSSSNANYNWFGNNATNYDMAPETNNVDINTWLFLNATANPDAMTILDSSDIVFKLYAYNSSEVSEYDNGRLKAVSLTLTPTNGRVNATRTILGEPVQYNPDSCGIGMLSAAIENAVYTITLKITDGTTFFDLNRTINGNDNDTIILDKDYTYDPAFDYDLSGGIVINRPLTIIGNNHTLDADGKAMIFVVQADNVTIENTTFANGKAEMHGGAIYWNGDSGNVSGCSFSNNYAKFRGGAIYWNFTVGSVVSDCSFVDNSVYFSGAAICFVASVGCVVSDCSFVHNSATERAGAIYLDTCDDCIVSDCSFVRNSASKYDGGAILWESCANGNVSDCSFEYNSADYGGAIYWKRSADGVVSDCSFVKNSASTHGGAIEWERSADGVVSDCSFVNNTAKWNGGAFYWYLSDRGFVSGCSFVNNTAKKNAGALFWYSNEGVVSGCIFVNNSAVDNSVIKFYNGDNHNLSVNDNIFLNNDAVAINFDRSDSTSNADYNWFGNNATNYDIAPITNNVEITTWLFLNATANPDSISVSESSDILFKLYSYSSAGISDYENSKLPVVNLTLTANNGNLNESTVALGDSVEFTPSDVGDASVTAAIENAEYTIVLDVTKTDTILLVDNLTMSYKDGSKLIVRLLDGDNNPISNALIYVNNTVTVYKYRTDADGFINVPVNLKPNEYAYNIIYEGDTCYNGVNVTRTVVVDKGDVFIFVEDVNVTYKENENYAVTVCDVNGDPVSGVTVNVDNGIKVLRYRTGADGVANVPVTLKPGEYTFTVSFDGNALYKAAGNSSAVVVNKAIVNMDAVDLVVGYKDGSNFTATLTDAEGNAISGVTVKFDNGVNAYRYHTDANGVASAPIKLKPGTYTYVISFAGNSIYASANITKTLTVEKGTPNLEASNVTVEYKNGNLTARLTDADGNAIVGATVKFTNGASTYRYHTDADGVAIAPINVKPGEYDYTIGFDGNSLYGAVNTTAKVVVNKLDAVLTADNISMTFKDGTNYTARLTDSNGNAIAGVIVKINNTVGVYKYKTDTEGYIHVPINLRLGEYAFTAFIEGSDIYNDCNVTSTVVITR